MHIAACREAPATVSQLFRIASAVLNEMQMCPTHHVQVALNRLEVEAWSHPSAPSDMRQTSCCVMQVALDRLEVEASGSPSARSVRSSRALEGAVRLRDLASPVRPRSMHGPRAPSPGRGQVSEDVVRRLEEHDDQQV